MNSSSPDLVLLGPSSLTLDAKGRIAVPARYRDLLKTHAIDRMWLTKNNSGCLMLMPQPVWRVFCERVMALPMESAAWRRFYLGHAQELEIDSASRVSIAPELRQFAGLDKEVRLLGVGSYFELWDAARHEQHEQETLQQAMPASVGNMNFSF